MVQLENDFKLALDGFQIWHHLIQTYQLTTEEIVLLLPSQNRQYNYYAMSLLDPFLKRKKVNRVLILTYDEAVKESAFLFTDREMKIVWFTREQAVALMKYYCLYEFTDQLVIASLEEPNGRLGKGFLKKPGITLEELFALSVYQLENVPKNKFQYSGENKKIIEFILSGESR